jgi:hypothetical protein
MTTRPRFINGFAALIWFAEDAMNAQAAMIENIDHKAGAYRDIQGLNSAGRLT